MHKLRSPSHEYTQVMKQKTKYWHDELLLEDTSTTEGITKVSNYLQFPTELAKIPATSNNTCKNTCNFLLYCTVIQVALSYLKHCPVVSEDGQVMAASTVNGEHSNTAHRT